MRWEGSAMLRRSPRRTLEAIVTQAVALIVALGKTDLSAPRRSRRNQKHRTAGQSRAREVAAFSRARWQSAVDRNHAGRSCPPQPSDGIDTEGGVLPHTGAHTREPGMTVWLNR